MTPQERLRDQLCEQLRRHLVGVKAWFIPEGGLILWRAFCDLNNARTYHMSGANPISYSEIDAWARLNRYPLASHHVAILRAMDTAWLEHAYADRKTDQSYLTRSPGQAITAAAFDAVFG